MAVVVTTVNGGNNTGAGNLESNQIASIGDEHAILVDDRRGDVNDIIPNGSECAAVG